MLNFLNPNYRKSLFSFALVPFVIASGGIGSRDTIYNSTYRDGQIIAQNTFTGWVASFWQRRPKTRLISRGNISPIAPGLVETYIVWSDRPLFMWQNPGNNQDVQLIVRDLENQSVVWEQTVNLADQKVFYNAKNPLEAGKQYQWQLSTTTQWRTFQVMSTDERNKIQASLQTLEQKLRATRASTEEIALRKADYFLNYPIKHKTDNDIHHLWSDALQTLFQVDQPSPDFKKNREAYVAGLFKSEDSTAERSNK